MNNPFSLEGKTILITGASSGIGKATAIACSKMGATMVITARNEQRLQETFSHLEGVNHQWISADLCDDDALNDLCEKIPVLNGVFFGAGISDTTPIKYLNRGAINGVIDINLIAPMLLTQCLLKNKKIAKAASLIYMSSMGVEDLTPGLSIYAVSKNGLNAFVRAVATEQASRKVRANAIMASMVKTDLIASLEQLSGQDLINAESKYPLGFGKADDIANAAIYLLSDASSWMTGSFIKLDGGSTLSL